MHLVIDGVIFGLQKSGGISRMWAEILLQLNQAIAKKERVTVLVPRNQNVEWKRIVGDLSHLKIVKRKRFHWNERKLFWERFYLTRLAFRMRPTLWQSTFFVGFPVQKNIQRVACLYDMIPEMLGSASPYDTFMKYKTLQQAHGTMVISQHSQKDLETFWPEFKGRSEVMPISTSERKISLSRPQPYFVYVGVRKGYKNALPAIEAILKDPRFEKYSIRFVGGEKWSKEEEEMFRHLNAEKRIQQLGILALEEIQSIITKASALLFPSLYEGFGLPVLEAFQLGVPVLACNTSSIPEITGPDYPLADPTNPQTFPDVLEKLLSSREQWIAYGHSRENLFSRQKMLTALLNCYEKRLGRAF